MPLNEIANLINQKHNNRLHRNRYARKLAHKAFDRLWVPGGKAARIRAYLWLAGKLECEPREAHIASMNVGRCLRLIQVCRAIEAWEHHWIMTGSGI